MSKGGGYVTLTGQEKQDFLDFMEMPRPHKKEGHSPVFGKHYCKNSGLVYLKNKLSEWAISKGCNYTVHPQYKSAIKRYTSL